MVVFREDNHLLVNLIIFLFFSNFTNICNTVWPFSFNIGLPQSPPQHSLTCSLPSSPLPHLRYLRFSFGVCLVGHPLNLIRVACVSTGKGFLIGEWASCSDYPSPGTHYLPITPKGGAEPVMEYLQAPFCVGVMQITTAVSL